MSRVRFLVLLLGLMGIGASLACGGMGDISMPSAELTDPWKKMGVPIDDGTVLYSDRNTLSVQYSGNQVDKIAKGYIKAIEKAGLKKQNESASGDTVAVQFKGKKGICNLAVTIAAGNTIVAATMQ